MMEAVRGYLLRLTAGAFLSARAAVAYTKRHIEKSGSCFMRTCNAAACAHTAGSA